MKYALIIAVLFVLPLRQQGGYDGKYVIIKTLAIGGERYGVVRLLRTGNHVRIKYFAARSPENVSVDERFRQWAVFKNIIGYSSGAYMTNCYGIAAPVGLCLDEGHMVNAALVENGLDGLVVAYADGGLGAFSLKAGNIVVTDENGRLRLNPRSSAYDKQLFINWAKKGQATVFQSHLLVYDDTLQVGRNGSPTVSPRRVLAVCKEDNEITHYIINLPNASTLYDGARKALDYLKKYEGVARVAFMINLDTGCQDIFTLYDRSGKKIARPPFQGNDHVTASQATNLLVYYYE